MGKSNSFKIYGGDDGLALLARQRPPTDYLDATSGVSPGVEVYFVTPPGESQKSLHSSDRGDYVVFNAASIDNPEDFNGFTGLIDRNLLPRSEWYVCEGVVRDVGFS